MISRICVWTTVILTFAGTAAAQPAIALDQPAAVGFGGLEHRIAIGETVDVVDATGLETRGRVSLLSQQAVTVLIDQTRREFAAGDVRQIARRRPDPVRNGILIGAGAGALVGFRIGRSADSAGCPRSGVECGQGAMIGAVGGALWGAVGGWITDALIRKREVVYAAPR